MANKNGDKKKPVPLDPKVADKLLDLLSTDNNFRRLFKKDPGAALEKAGYQSPKGTPTLESPLASRAAAMSPPVCCLRVQSIAPKAEVLKARAALKQMLTQGLAYTTPQLDASSTATRITRK